jgi:hypothetical protein
MTPQLKLVHALLGKSIAETLLVGSLAIYFFFSSFPPYFKGWGEATHDSIAGWAVDTSAPEARVNVQLFIDGRFIANGTANQSRPDVRAAGWATDDWHGFNFLITFIGKGNHEARVYALKESKTRQTLQLLGDPIRFIVHEDGRITEVK